MPDLGMTGRIIHVAAPRWGRDAPLAAPGRGQAPFAQRLAGIAGRLPRRGDAASGPAGGPHRGVAARQVSHAWFWVWSRF